MLASSVPELVLPRGLCTGRSRCLEHSSLRGPQGTLRCHLHVKPSLTLPTSTSCSGVHVRFSALCPPGVLVTFGYTVDFTCPQGQGFLSVLLRVVFSVPSTVPRT